MPPPDLDDGWSDSDDELEANVETAVQLGVPDGPLSSPTDLLDPAVSRIGGHPVRCPFAFLRSHPVLISFVYRSIHLPSRLISCTQGIHVRSAALARWRNMHVVRRPYGAPHPNLVSARIKPGRPRPVRLCLCQRLLSAQRWQVRDSPDALGGPSLISPRTASEHGGSSDSTKSTQRSSSASLCGKKSGKLCRRKQPPPLHRRRRSLKVILLLLV